MKTEVATLSNRVANSALLEKLGIFGVLALAALLRFINLGYPKSLVFDETYYVKDAFTLAREGAERSWPDSADQTFQSGQSLSYLTDPAFVVHPPLGKWLISLGMTLFGADSSFGWRFSIALFGVMSVGLLMLVAYRLFLSTKAAIAAGFLMAIDGLSVVMSRTSLLDGFLTFFVLLAFLFLIMDQEVSRKKTAEMISKANGSGVVLLRPWLIAAGIALGMATAVKWSGLYFLAAFGLYVVVSEALLRRRAGDENWFANGILKQGPITFLNLVPISLAVYLISWSGWILTSGGYARNWSEANPATGFFSIFPNWLQSLWHYHQVAYNFHVGLTTEHSYSSHPLTWLIGIRPTAFFYESAAAGSANCPGLTDCSSAITALGNPAIWWFATVAVLFLVYRFIRYRERMIGLILLGLAAGYLPWLLFSERTMFQFYAVSFQPWMILALVLTVQLLLYKQSPEGRKRAQVYVASYFVFVSLLAVFFMPIYLGTWIPFWYWQAHMWLPSWI